jgi:Flp pilus assembly pilin Flp
MNRFLQDERGTTSIEYVVIAMGIFFAIVTAVTTLGTRLAAVFPAVSDALK